MSKRAPRFGRLLGGLVIAAVLAPFATAEGTVGDGEVVATHETSDAEVEVENYSLLVPGEDGIQVVETLHLTRATTAEHGAVSGERTPSASGDEEERITLHLPAFEGASSFAFLAGWGDVEAEPTGETIRASIPLPPTEARTLVYAYRLAWAGPPGTLTRPQSSRPDAHVVLLPADSPLEPLASTDLVDLGVERFLDREVRAYRVEGWGGEDEWLLALRGSDSLPSAGVTVPVIDHRQTDRGPWLPLLIGAVGVGCGWLVTASVRRRRENGIAVLSPIGNIPVWLEDAAVLPEEARRRWAQNLLQKAAGLEAAYRRGEVPAVRYKQEMEAWKLAWKHLVLSGPEDRNSAADGGERA